MSADGRPWCILWSHAAQKSSGRTRTGAMSALSCDNNPPFREQNDGHGVCDPLCRGAARWLFCAEMTPGTTPTPQPMAWSPRWGSKLPADADPEPPIRRKRSGRSPCLDDAFRGANVKNYAKRPVSRLSGTTLKCPDVRLAAQRGLCTCSNTPTHALYHRWESATDQANLAISTGSATLAGAIGCTDINRAA